MGDSGTSETSAKRAEEAAALDETRPPDERMARQSIGESVADSTVAATPPSAPSSPGCMPMKIASLLNAEPEAEALPAATRATNATPPVGKAVENDGEHGSVAGVDVALNYQDQARHEGQPKPTPTPPREPNAMELLLQASSMAQRRGDSAPSTISTVPNASVSTEQTHDCTPATNTTDNEVAPPSTKEQTRRPTVSESEQTLTTTLASEPLPSKRRAPASPPAKRSRTKRAAATAATRAIHAVTEGEHPHRVSDPDIEMAVVMSLTTEAPTRTSATETPTMTGARTNDGGDGDSNGGRGGTSDRRPRRRPRVVDAAPPDESLSMMLVAETKGTPVESRSKPKSTPTKARAKTTVNSNKKLPVESKRGSKMKTRKRSSISNRQMMELIGDKYSDRIGDDDDDYDGSDSDTDHRQRYHGGSAHGDNGATRKCEFCRLNHSALMTFRCSACRRVYHDRCLVRAFQDQVTITTEGSASPNSAAPTNPTSSPNVKAHSKSKSTSKSKSKGKNSSESEGASTKSRPAPCPPLEEQMARLRLHRPAGRAAVLRCASCEAAFKDFYRFGQYQWDTCQCPTCTTSPQKIVSYRRVMIKRIIDEHNMEVDAKKLQSKLTKEMKEQSQQSNSDSSVMSRGERARSRRNRNGDVVAAGSTGPQRTTRATRGSGIEGNKADVTMADGVEGEGGDFCMHRDIGGENVGVSMAPDKIEVDDAPATKDATSQAAKILNQETTSDTLPPLTVDELSKIVRVVQERPSVTFKIACSTSADMQGPGVFKEGTLIWSPKRPATVDCTCCIKNMSPKKFVEHTDASLLETNNDPYPFLFVVRPNQELCPLSAALKILREQYGPSPSSIIAPVVAPLRDAATATVVVSEKNVGRCPDDETQDRAQIALTKRANAMALLASIEYGRLDRARWKKIGGGAAVDTVPKFEVRLLVSKDSHLEAHTDGYYKDTVASTGDVLGTERGYREARVAVRKSMYHKGKVLCNCCNAPLSSKEWAVHAFARIPDAPELRYHRLHMFVRLRGESPKMVVRYDKFSEAIEMLDSTSAINAHIAALMAQRAKQAQMQ